MSLPTELTYGKVEGRFLLALGDGADVDTKPDGIAASGTIKFTPSVSMVQFFGFAEPVSIAPEEIVCTLDSEGYLLDPQGVRGVWLVATDSVDSAPAAWSYKVTITLTGNRKRTFSMSVPAGVTTNLASAMPPVTSSPISPSFITAILDARDGALVAVAAAEAAAADAEASATDAEESADAAEAAAGAAGADHGLLTGLGDDDHPQYLTQARGDARYPLATDVNNALAGKASTTALSNGLAGKANTSDLASKADASHTHTAGQVGAIPAGEVTVIDVLTQAEYNALVTKVATTLYIIQG